LRVEFLPALEMLSYIEKNPRDAYPRKLHKEFSEKLSRKKREDFGRLLEEFEGRGLVRRRNPEEARPGARRYYDLTETGKILAEAYRKTWFPGEYLDARKLSCASKRIEALSSLERRYGERRRRCVEILEELMAACLLTYDQRQRLLRVVAKGIEGLGDEAERRRLVELFSSIVREAARDENTPFADRLRGVVELSRLDPGEAGRIGIEMVGRAIPHADKLRVEYVNHVLWWVIRAAAERDGQVCEKLKRDLEEKASDPAIKQDLRRMFRDMARVLREAANPGEGPESG